MLPVHRLVETDRLLPLNDNFRIALASLSVAPSNQNINKAVITHTNYTTNKLLTTSTTPAALILHLHLCSINLRYLHSIAGRGLSQNIIYWNASTLCCVDRALEAEIAFHEEELTRLNNGSLRCGSVFHLGDWYALVSN